jgi:hypothetical protein
MSLFGKLFSKIEFGGSTAEFELISKALGRNTTVAEQMAYTSGGVEALLAIDSKY